MFITYRAGITLSSFLEVLVLGLVLKVFSTLAPGISAIVYRLGGAGVPISPDYFTPSLLDIPQPSPYASIPPRVYVSELVYRVPLVSIPH